MCTNKNLTEMLTENIKDSMKYFSYFLQHTAALKVLKLVLVVHRVWNLNFSFCKFFDK